VNSLSDQQLLRDYAECRSEMAFTELVRRHVDFVHSAALRMVRETHLAEDVTQGVFIALARNARQLMARSVLSVWLHRTAQNIAAQTVRSDVRRRTREQEAASMNELISQESEAGWEHIGRHLDAALGELNEADRDVVLLRYFHRKPASEVAQILGTSEDAAQKRVSRAVERLREYFAKHGITVGTTGLAIVITNNAVQAAPIGLAASIAGTALTGAAAGGTALTALKVMSMTKLKLGIVGAIAAAGVAAPLIMQHQSVVRLREENQSLQQQQSQMAQMAGENERLSNLLAQAKSAQTLPEDQLHELLRLRGEVGPLRRQSNEFARLQEENRQLRAKPVQIQQLAGGTFERSVLTPDETAKNACINNLRQIDGAMQQYALENKLSDTNSVTAEQIMPYLKRAEEVFRCPSGGTYTFGPVTNTPTCSIPGHAIPVASAKGEL